MPQDHGSAHLLYYYRDMAGEDLQLCESRSVIREPRHTSRFVPFVPFAAIPSVFPS
jgi:hypothetical protein